MKSTVETLSPTRVRLTVEVPFEELGHSLDHAYKTIGRQVRVQGFRPGKVPPRILDQRVGRGVVLEEAVNHAIPHFYGDAVRDNEVAVLGGPAVDVTDFADGGQLVFTAEVDVRPAVELTGWQGLPVTVADADVTDAEVAEQLSGLRDRFATLRPAERPAERGDYVSIDLSADVDGEPVPGAQASGLSYEVGSDSLVPGLDEAIVGLEEGGSRTFSTALVAGEYVGREAVATVTVRSVKVKELPELDDEFARMAGEFDSLDELRADTRERLERVKRVQQGVDARDTLVDVLLERFDIPLPESAVDGELQWRRESMEQQLEQAGMTLQEWADTQDRSVAELEAELAADARRAVQTGLLLDSLADAEDVGFTDAELTEVVVRRGRRLGISPDEYAQQLVQAGQLGALVAEVRRGKALALVLESAQITDESGRPVDLELLREDVQEVGLAASGDLDLDAVDEADAPVDEADAPVDDADAPVHEADAPVDEADAPGHDAEPPGDAHPHDQVGGQSHADPQGDAAGVVAGDAAAAGQEPART